MPRHEIYQQKYKTPFCIWRRNTFVQVKNIILFLQTSFSLTGNGMAHRTWSSDTFFFSGCLNLGRSL